MNAKERKRLIGAIETYLPLEYREPIILGVKLLAAAEANDGSTPETNDLAALLTNRTMDEGIILDRMRDIERERTGLAARVRELEAGGDLHAMMERMSK